MFKVIDISNGTYEVSSEGRIRRVLRRVGYNYLNGSKKGKGYLSVRVNNKKFLVHRLIAIAFIPNPENKPEVNHVLL